MTLDYHTELGVSIRREEFPLLPSSVGQTVEFRDDDSLQPLLPEFSPIGDKTKTIYKHAYMDIISAEYNPNKTIEFSSNLSELDIRTGRIWDNSQDIASAESFWVSHLSVCYQFSFALDGDGGDGDGSIYYGASINETFIKGSLIFLETLRERGDAPNIRDRTIKEEDVELTMAHEITHMAQEDHTEEGLMRGDPRPGDWFFDIETIRKMRKVVKW
jgi:hypothetical protein